MTSLLPRKSNESEPVHRIAVDGFPYFRVLLSLYAVCYGGMLLYSRGLPYVMDANESFSVFWHAYNLLHFDVSQSLGLTDEAYGVSAAAHPYLHTHQGNMPRLFGALIYALGARSIESQIVVTTTVIGTATVAFAFLTMRRLANPLFAFVFTALLLTDYLQFAQWNVVTYRVWYGFLFFGILLGIMCAPEARGRWAMAGLFGSFVLLFYNELVFAGLMAIIAGLFTIYWHRGRLRLALKLWAIEAAGAATALSILLTQLVSKFGADVVKQDFATTFLMRNLSDNVGQQEAAIEFLGKHRIVFWLNFSDSSSLRNLSAFVKSQTTYIFQLYTPWLMLLAATILGAFLLSVVSERRFFAGLMGRAKSFRLPTQVKSHGPWLASALGVVLVLAVPVGVAFGRVDVVLGLAAGVAAAAACAHQSMLGRNGIAALRTSDIGMVVQVLAISTTAFFLFFRPMSFVLVSRIAFAVSTCVVCLAYGTSSRFGATVRSGLSKLETVGTWCSAFLPPRQLTVCLLMILGMVISLVGFRVAVGAEVFGMQPGTSKLSPSWLLLGCGATVFLVFAFGHALGAKWVEPARLSLLRVSVLIGFLVMLTVFINYQWRLYDQSYSSLWLLPFGFPGGTPVGRALVLASVVLGGFLIVFGWSRFMRTTQAKVLAGPLVLLVIGELALLVILYLSPGYVISGYLNRTAPFAVFFTSIPVAMTFYLLAITGSRALATARLSSRCTHFPASRILASWVAKPRLGAGIAAGGMLLALSVYWIGLQAGFVRILPPNYFAVLKELRTPPFVGKSAVVMTYAAPVAAMTGKWAYFDTAFFLNGLHRTDSGYVVERDIKTHLWLADRDTNDEYRRPDYFICLWPQSLRNAVADRDKGFQDVNNYCPRLPIVDAAANSTGLMRHELIAADTSSRGSWAIVELDHELPPLAQGVTATLVPGKAGLTAKASYRYLQQDGTSEGATVVDLVGDRDGHCKLGKTPVVLASGWAGDKLAVPRGFSGTIALRVTPVSIRKAGEPRLSNQFVVRASAHNATSCPVDVVLDFRDPDNWRKHVTAGLKPPGPSGSFISGREAKLVVDIPTAARGTVKVSVVWARAIRDQDLRMAYEVNGQSYGPFDVDRSESSVEHEMRVPAVVLRRQIPVSISISIESDGIAPGQVALQELIISNRER